MSCYDPKIYSDSEVDQHLNPGLDIARKHIENCKLYENNAAAHLEVDYGSWQENSAARFLASHPKCEIGIEDEYDREYPVKEEVDAKI